MRKALVIFYRWLNVLPIGQQLFGEFAHWLLELVPKDIKCLRLALQALGDRIEPVPAPEAPGDLQARCRSEIS